MCLIKKTGLWTTNIAKHLSIKANGGEMEPFISVQLSEKA